MRRREVRFGSWLCKNAVTRGTDRTNIPPHDNFGRDTRSSPDILQRSMDVRSTPESGRRSARP